MSRHLMVAILYGFGMSKNKTSQATPQEVFEHAIKTGFLVEQENHDRSVYDYMYMYSDDKGDHFKHIMTRNYITNKDSYEKI